MRLPLLFACLGVGCGGWSPLWPDLRTPEDHARGMLARCAHESSEAETRALSPLLIEAVEPAYSTVPSGNDRAIHLRGARLHVRPDLNVSAESLQRTLECHQSRITLADAGELARDPYVLQGVWLDIRVASSGDGLVASVLTDKLDDARRVLDRARTYAAEHR